MRRVFHLETKATGEQKLKKHTTMKKIIISIFLLIPIIAFSQDTIYVNKVKICNVVYNKSGHVYKKFFKNIKVKTGYIVNKGHGVYEINGKEMEGSLTAKK